MFGIKDEFGKRLEYSSKVKASFRITTMIGIGGILQEVISRFVEELKATGLKEYADKIDFETL